MEFAGSRNCVSVEAGRMGVSQEICRLSLPAELKGAGHNEVCGHRQRITSVAGTPNGVPYKTAMARVPATAAW